MYSDRCTMCTVSVYTFIWSKWKRCGRGETIGHKFNCMTSFLWLFYKWDWMSIGELWHTIYMCIVITMRQWIYNFPSHSRFFSLYFSHTLPVGVNFCLPWVFFLKFRNRCNMNIFCSVILKKRGASMCIFFFQFHSKWATAKKTRTKWLHVHTYNSKVKCRKYHGFWCECVCACVYHNFENEYLSSLDVCSRCSFIFVSRFFFRG